MSIRLRIAVAAGLCALAGLAGTARAEMVAPPQADPPKKVTVVSCASGGIPEFCIMLKAGAQSYNVTGARPALPIGKLVRMTGTTTDRLSPCGGVVLADIKWTAVNGQCPK
jgi:hypothetical protein